MSEHVTDELRSLAKKYARESRYAEADCAHVLLTMTHWFRDMDHHAPVAAAEDALRACIAYSNASGWTALADPLWVLRHAPAPESPR